MESKEQKKIYMAKYYKKNKKRILARNRVWSRKNKKRHRFLVNRWNKENNERKRAVEKLWEKLHPQSGYERNRKWRKKNPEKCVVMSAKRRTLKTQAGGAFTVEEFKDLCKEYNNLCLCCGKCKKLTADHVIPVSKGGTSNIDNIQPLCKSCNSKKGTKTTDYRKSNLKETVPNQPEEK